MTTTHDRAPDDAQNPPKRRDGTHWLYIMSEARAVTNFSGNAIATLLVGTWTGTIDADRVREVLDGRRPFDESILELDPHRTEDADETSGIAEHTEVALRK